MTPQEMTQIRTKRYKDAVALIKPDRVPINLNGPCFIKFGDPTAVMADYIRRPKWADEQVLKAYQLPVFDEIDMPPMAGTADFLTFFAAGWFAKMKLPGVDLPEDAIWQIDEQGPMTEEDYDYLIDKGWGAMTQVLNERIGFDPAKLPPPDVEYQAEIQKKIAALGRADLGGGPMGAGGCPTFETLSAARSIFRFYRDIHRMPDKVKAAIEVMDEELLSGIQKAVDTLHPYMAGIGGTRAGSDFISRKVFEKYYWPFVSKLTQICADGGSVVSYHLDSNWEGFLEYFKEVPAGKGIFDPDSLTPIFKIRDVLGDRMAITGDVPPSLLSVGSADEVYKYSRRLVEEMGPGFIMSSGCSLPPNAKPENVKALIQACLD